jgi:hypothetical protein
MVLAVYLAFNDPSAKFLFPLCIAAFLSTGSAEFKKEPVVIRPLPDAVSQQNVDSPTKAPEEAAAAQKKVCATVARGALFPILEFPIIE